jgi:uncharacterized protein (TIGR00369 family)
VEVKRYAGSAGAINTLRRLMAERGGFDGISKFLDFRWTAADSLHLRIEEKHINGAGLLSGAVTFAMVDYCMGSTLWRQKNEGERIATINIAINYVQTATSGEIVCKSVLDRRNKTLAVLRSEVTAEDGRLLATAIGSYTIFPKKDPPDPAPEPAS